MDISINTDKMVAISINPKTSDIFLIVSGSPISIAKTGKAYQHSSNLNVFNTDSIGVIYSSLKNAFLSKISIYTDGSIKNFGTSSAARETAAYFSDLGLHIRVKSHSGVLGNKHTNRLADLATSSGLVLLANIKKKFLLANSKAIFDNAYSLYMSKATSGLYTYLIKALYKKLPVVIKKHLYDHSYSSVLCVCCKKVNFSDHSFVYGLDFSTCQGLLSKYSSFWKFLTSATLSSSVVFQSLALSASDIELYMTTIGPSVAILTKSIMESGFNIGVKPAESRKKRRGGALKNNIENRKFAAAKTPSGHSWSSETGDITESDSVNIKKEFLVEETSFDYREGDVLTGGNLEQTLKNSKILTKRALSKPLRKIDFLGNDGDNILLDKSVVLLPPFEKLSQCFCQKIFRSGHRFGQYCWEICSGKAYGNQKIIKVTFTSELSLMQALKKIKEAKILALVLKKIPIGMSTEAVCTALFEFGLIKSIKMQLVELWQKAVVEFEQINHADLVIAKWSILIGKDAVHVARSDMNKESWDA
ncbi:hypothetical protein G9A89_013372 [Geosiphon pyriformis]|nr:hypothetical protein G9A89_013372 [Geosiphon pyriformis]